MAWPGIMRLKIHSCEQLGEQPFVAAFQLPPLNHRDGQSCMLSPIRPHEPGNQIGAGGDGGEVHRDPAGPDAGVGIRGHDHPRLRSHHQR